jgi:hypothetical protein
MAKTKTASKPPDTRDTELLRVPANVMLKLRMIAMTSKREDGTKENLSEVAIRLWKSGGIDTEYSHAVKVSMAELNK